jgi:hypothetical protein
VSWAFAHFASRQIGSHLSSRQATQSPGFKFLMSLRVSLVYSVIGKRSPGNEEQQFLVLRVSVVVKALGQWRSRFSSARRVYRAVGFKAQRRKQPSPLFHPSLMMSSRSPGGHLEGKRYLCLIWRNIKNVVPRTLGVSEHLLQVCD